MTSIGQALLERNAVNSKLQDILQRIQNNVLVSIKNDGTIDTPNEDCVELINQAEILENRHELISNALINANYTTIVKYENSDYKVIEIIEMISRFSKRVKQLKELLTVCESGTSIKRKNNSWSSDNDDKEKQKCLLNMAEIRNKIDKFCSNKNKLQVILQEVNWSTKINY